MATMCPYNVQCKSCPHYRLSDEEPERMVCYLNTDANRHDAVIAKKKEFAEVLGKTLKMAKSHLVSCKYEVDDNNEEWIRVGCQNGYEYKICVTADSLAAMAVDVFRAMESK